MSVLKYDLTDEIKIAAMVHYRTLSEAALDLKGRGYSIDFNLGFNGVFSYKSAVFMTTDKFRIAEVYRFRSEIDSGNQATIYAIESPDGYKGILVNDFGLATDPVSDEMHEMLDQC